MLRLRGVGPLVVSVLVILSSCVPRLGALSSGGGDAALPSDGAPARFVLTVTSDGPRWLGPTWWDDRGLDSSRFDPDTVQLLLGDEPVPYLWLESPDGPGLLFLGQTVSTTIGLAGAYTLVVGERVPTEAPEMVPLDVGADCQSSTVATRWIEQDTSYRPTAPLDLPWLWQPLRPADSFEVAVDLPNLVVSSPVLLTVRAWGQSAMPQDPDHHLRLTWNGTAVEDHFWDGRDVEQWSMDLPGSGPADNTLVLDAPGGTEAPVELTWIDGLGVTWRRSLVVNENDWYEWRAETTSAACWEVGGTSDDSEALIALLVDSDGYVRRGELDLAASPGTARVAQRAGDTGWIGVPWRAPAPDHVRSQEALVDGSLDAVSYLVVAPDAFHDALEPLVARRKGEGLEAGLITPQAVYDTFGEGIPEAAAIQAMVRRLTEEGSLSYLLLVGDTSPDPSTGWAEGSTGVPTAWVRTSYVGQTASDYALATGGTEEALIAVGRIPAGSADEVEDVVAKTLDWKPNSRLLLVSDDEPEFAGLVAKLGEGRDVDQVLDAGADDVRREIFRWLGDGPGTLVYAGHGSLQLLGDEKLLIVDDGQNWSEATVVASWSCLCAGFAHPSYQSLGEALLLAPKGVVAFVGPTGETTTSEQTAMAVEFQIALSDGDTVGDALLRAWRKSISENSQKGFLLLGDPALRAMPGSAGDTVVDE